MFAAKPPPFVMLEYYPHALKMKGRSADDLVQFATKTGYRLWDCAQHVGSHSHALMVCLPQPPMPEPPQPKLGCL